MTSGAVNAEQHLYLVCLTSVRQEGHVNVTQIGVTTQTITLLRWEAAVQIGLLRSCLADTGHVVIITIVFPKCLQGLCVNVGGGESGSCTCVGCMCPDGVFARKNSCYPPTVSDYRIL